MERRNIILKRITLTNFKGVRSLTVDFDPEVTTIKGRNASGKTTLFDAFTWLLFGKDSQDRKQFGLKTRDAEGRIIPHLPHEVSATLSVNGRDITLTRRFTEVWTKRRGQAEAVFTGNTEERIYDDVPLSLKEWKAKMDSICTEEVFKYITNPLYFSQQKPDVQREMLCRMVGNITPEYVISCRPSLAHLLDDLSGKTIDELRREIAAKKRRLKTELDLLPARIDERLRDQPEAEDWEAIESELADKRKRIAEIDTQLQDKAAMESAAQDRRVQAIRKMGLIRDNIAGIEAGITREAFREWNSRSMERQKIEGWLAGWQTSIKRYETDLEDAERKQEECKARRAELIEQWRRLNAQKIEFADNDFICPTCHRQLDVEGIEARQQEMTEAFNRRKAQQIEQNVAQGKANTARMEEAEKQADLLRLQLAAVKDNITKYTAQLHDNPLPERPDVQPLIDADKGRQSLLAELADLEKQATQASDESDAAEDARRSELKEEKQMLGSAVSELQQRLAKRDIIRQNEARLDELNREMRTKSEELAKLEGRENELETYSKDRAEIIETAVNDMFTIVKFKLFETQVNGAEVETCVATVDGQPFNDGLNAAGRINAGLDIISAICKSEGVSAPIFIDNAESVNKLLPTSSQLIRLVVTDDPKLTIGTEK